MNSRAAYGMGHAAACCNIIIAFTMASGYSLGTNMIKAARHLLSHAAAVMSR